jgi:hypothetical protein
MKHSGVCGCYLSSETFIIIRPLHKYQLVQQGLSNINFECLIRDRLSGQSCGDEAKQVGGKRVRRAGAKRNRRRMHL